LRGIDLSGVIIVVVDVDVHGLALRKFVQVTSSGGVFGILRSGARAGTLDSLARSTSASNSGTVDGETIRGSGRRTAAVALASLRRARTRTTLTQNGDDLITSNGTTAVIHSGESTGDDDVTRAVTVGRLLLRRLNHVHSDVTSTLIEGNSITQNGHRGVSITRKLVVLREGSEARILSVFNNNGGGASIAVTTVVTSTELNGSGSASNQTLRTKVVGNSNVGSTSITDTGSTIVGQIRSDLALVTSTIALISGITRLSGEDRSSRIGDNETSGSVHGVTARVRSGEHISSGTSATSSIGGQLTGNDRDSGSTVVGGGGTSIARQPSGTGSSVARTITLDKKIGGGVVEERSSGILNGETTSGASRVTASISSSHNNTNGTTSGRTSSRGSNGVVQSRQSTHIEGLSTSTGGNEVGVITSVTGTVTLDSQVLGRSGESRTNGILRSECGSSVSLVTADITDGEGQSERTTAQSLVSEGRSPSQGAVVLAGIRSTSTTMIGDPSKQLSASLIVTRDSAGLSTRVDDWRSSITNGISGSGRVGETAAISGNESHTSSGNASTIQLREIVGEGGLRAVILSTSTTIVA